MERLRQENARLKKMLGQAIAETEVEERAILGGPLLFPVEVLPSVTAHPSVEEKIALFRLLFRGKAAVVVYDYADFQVPVLKKMHFLKGDKP